MTETEKPVFIDWSGELDQAAEDMEEAERHANDVYADHLADKATYREYLEAYDAYRKACDDLNDLIDRLNAESEVR